MSGKLTVLIGLPRSGKSTYATKWIGYDDYGSNPRVVVNSDEIRLALHGERYNRLAEPFVHAVTKVMIRSLYNQGYHLLIDETNTSIGSIRQWLQIDPDAEFVYINASVEECERRAIACEQNDLVDKNVIKRMYSNLVNLANYTLEQRILSGEYSGFMLQEPYYDDVLMSVEDIRLEEKNK